MTTSSGFRPVQRKNGSTVAENFQGRGYKLDSTRERELESEPLAETRSDGLAKELKLKNEKILHLRKKLNRTSDAKIQNDSNIKQFKEEIKQLKEEIKQLQILQKNGRIKLLEEELFSAQNDLSLIKFENKSLKSKLTELEHMNNELVQTKDELSLKVGEVECLKLEAISLQVELQSDESIVGGNEPQENKMNSQDEKSLRKYLRKDILEKNGKASTAKMPEVNSSFNDTSQIAKQINVSGGNIPNSSLDKSNSEISVGGIEAIPAIASVLGSPKIPWLMLTLLIIIVVLVRFIRPILNANKKNEPGIIRPRITKNLLPIESKIF
nr:10256_t:CDS:2 [Entrophospora candida]